MLLLRQHEDCKDQLRRKHRLNEDALGDRSVFGERRSYIEVCWKHDLDKKRCKNRTGDLCREKQEATDVVDRFGHDHAEGDRWIEETTTDSEEDPDVDQQAEAEGHRDIQIHDWAEADCGVRGSAVCALLGSDVGDYCTCESKPEEHGGADQLAQKCDEMVSKRAPDAMSERKPQDSIRSSAITAILPDDIKRSALPLRLGLRWCPRRSMVADGMIIWVE